jgi:methylphosphotriester-DNA--protein-cysteine methyltransferase
MRPIESAVVTLRLRDDLLDALMRSLSVGRSTVVIAEGWPELRDYVIRSAPGAVCVVDPFRPGGRDEGLADELRDSVRQLPWTTFVAALEFDPGDPHLLRTLLDWGTADLLDTGRETFSDSLARRLREARRCTVERLFRYALPTTMTGRARAMLMSAMQVAAFGGGVDDLARAMETGPRTVTRWFERVGLPHPRRSMTWLRLLLVGAYLDVPSRSIEAVAHAAGYVSAASLRLTLRKFLDTNPVEMRENGALDYVATRFREDLFKERHQGRSALDSTWLHAERGEGGRRR